MASTGKCILCGNESYIQDEFLTGAKQINCQNCGSFQTSREFFEDVASYKDSQWHLLSGYIREMNELEKTDLLITSDNYKDMLLSPIIPQTVGEQFDKFILFLYRRTRSLRDRLPVNLQSEYALCYAHNPAEATMIEGELLAEKYIEQMTNPVTLIFKGVQYAEKIQKEYHVSNVGFVAMWFDKEMEHTYKNAIKPAIEATECGCFKAFRVDNYEHNNDITDEIIAGIKSSRFIVADMTGYRGGVYFEAGYAKGLGKPVIFSCREDWFTGEKDSEGKTLKEKIHFDINHQNIIVWKTELELKNESLTAFVLQLYELIALLFCAVT